MNEYREILEQTLELLHERLGFVPSVFKLWFDGLELTELDEERAVFTTPTNIKKKILSTKHKTAIEECLSSVIGFDVKCDFISLQKEESEKSLLDKKAKAEEQKAKAAELAKSFIEENKDKTQSVKRTEKLPVLEQYTFDNFIEGSSNKYAKTACFAVANEPNFYNPLFIYGNSGLGKTHLLHAVINHIKKNNPELRFIYKKSEDFINELILAIKNGTTQSFKDTYRNVDVLLLDDIQFIAGKPSTQEEFFHTISILYEADKQIILTSDRPPQEINPLEERLRTRFEGGLMADVQPPNFELRVAIIQKKCEDLKLELSNDIINYIAERLRSNVRQIEGVLKKISLQTSCSSAPLTKSEIEHIISVVDPTNIPNDIMVERILGASARVFGVKVEEILSAKRADNIANARHFAIYIIRRLTEMSYETIGKIFNRHHTTIMASYSTMELEIKTVKGMEEKVNKVIKEIKPR